MATTTMEKNSLFKYFEILKNKFFKIMLLNAIFFTVFTIALIISMGITYAANAIFGEINDFWTILTASPLIFLGPVTAAIMKVMRDYVREEPAFFLDDLKKAFKDNFKQSIIISTLQYVAVWLLIIAGGFYYSFVKADAGIFYTIGLGVTMFVAIAVIAASYYVYMMTVTLKLKIREIIKNSFIFTMLCILRNILLTVVLAFWIGLNLLLVYLAIISQNALLYGIVICVFMVLTFGIIFYTVAFFTFPPIKRYILDPYYEAHPSESSKSVIDKPDAQDISYNAKEEQKELPEFVYHNGKMIHRSAFEEEQVFSDERIIPDKD